MFSSKGGAMKRSILVLFAISVFLFSTFLAAAEKITFAASYRNLTDEYWVVWDAGAKNASESLGAAFLGLSADDDEAKQVADLEVAIARGVKALTVMPATAGALGSLIELCESKHVYAVSMWDRPASLTPDKYKYWVGHITMDSVKQGYTPAKALFEKMGGKGNIVALEGKPGTGSAEDRYLGLSQALKEYPGIKLLGHQTANYNRVDAVKVMEDFLSAYGGKIDGIWSANDDMALGAVEVLKPAGLAGGKIKITGVNATKEAVQAIINGDMTLTVSGDPWDMSGVGICYAYEALKGNILPESKQIIVLPSPVIDASNAKAYFASAFAAVRTADWKKVAAGIEKQIKAAK
jgi:ribose transport system substrate-binding protein